jgi:hypothetical protein
MLHNMPPQPRSVNQVVQPDILLYPAGMESELKDQRVPVMMSESEVKNLDAWRRVQDDLPSRGEAIRRLIEAGLRAAAPAHKAGVLKLEQTGGAGRAARKKAAPG